MPDINGHHSQDGYYNFKMDLFAAGCLGLGSNPRTFLGKWLDDVGHGQFDMFEWMLKQRNYPEPKLLFYLVAYELYHIFLTSRIREVFALR